MMLLMMLMLLLMMLMMVPTLQGDFQFNPVCWPNISDTTQLLGNTKLLRSTYPWADKGSTNYNALLANKFFAVDSNGNVANPTHALIDATNPKAMAFVWDKCKTSFYDHGIEMFWLDDAEPNLNQAGLVYSCGPSEYCGGLWHGAHYRAEICTRGWHWFPRARLRAIQSHASRMATHLLADAVNLTTPLKAEWMGDRLC
jgi:alpha-glucosidase (family GH31 glycosyl hydrolase)